jgi:hypothetical protein
MIINKNCCRKQTRNFLVPGVLGELVSLLLLKLFQGHKQRIFYQRHLWDQLRRDKNPRIGRGTTAQVLVTLAQLLAKKKKRKKSMRG